MSEHTPLTEAERIAEILAGHRYVPGTPFLGLIFPVACGCGEKTPGWSSYEAHVADRLAARASTATADDEALRRAVVRETNLGLDDFRMGRASNDALASRMLDAIRPFTATADTGLRERVANLHALTEGRNREGTSRWPECCRDTYSLAIEEAIVALDATAAPTTDTKEKS